MFRQLGLKFRVVRSRYREAAISSTHPADLVVLHARGKAVKAVVPSKARYVVGADTLVWCRKQVLGKPRTGAEAYRMLAQLSDRVHKVYSAIVILDRFTGKAQTGVSMTKVYVKPLGRKAILHYMKVVRPFDKAGAYAIQEGPRIVRKIAGSYTNVVGLPVDLLRKMLRDLVKGKGAA